MYLRVTQRRNRDGSTVTYYALAEAVWNAEAKRREVKWARKMGPGVKLEKCRSVVIDGASDDDEDETED